MSTKYFFKVFVNAKMIITEKPIFSYQHLKKTIYIRLNPNDYINTTTINNNAINKSSSGQ